jgi:hypothetical protein
MAKMGITILERPPRIVAISTIECTDLYVWIPEFSIIKSNAKSG